MHTLDDRIRSLRRFVSEAMAGSGSAYDTQTQRAEVADDARPVGLVEAATPASALGSPRTTAPQGDVQQQQSFAVVLYPEFEAGEDARAARLRAHAHAQRLDDAVTLGLVNDDDSNLSPPFMLPLYDYAGVDVTGDGRADRPDDPYGWATVEDFTVQPIQDPLHDLRWSVAATLRLTWWRPGRIPPPAPIAAEMPPTQHVS